MFMTSLISLILVVNNQSRLHINCSKLQIPRLPRLLCYKYWSDINS